MTHSDKIITVVRQYGLDLFLSGLSTQQHVAKGLLNGIEYLVRKQFSNLDDLKKEIKQLALTNLNEQTSGYTKDVHVKKIEAERQNFLDFINRLDVMKLDEVKQLPYRRRLSQNESTLVRQNLKNNWNFDGWTSGEYYWEPLPLVSISPERFCFYNTEILSDTDYQNITSLLLTLNSDTIYEVTEDRLDYEIEATEFDKDSIETAYTDKNNSWIIYLSHERTIAFGGQQLIEELDRILIDKSELKNKW